jgi:hypothetical protein
MKKPIIKQMKKPGLYPMKTLKVQILEDRLQRRTEEAIEKNVLT